MKTSTKALFGGTGAAVVAAGIALSGGTSAFFYDVETSTGNSAEACSLDLQYEIRTVVQVTSAGQSTSEFDRGVMNGADGSFALADLQPGDQYRAAFDVTNAGDCAGDLTLGVDSSLDAENGLLEPEVAAGDTTPDTGELGDVVQVRLRETGSAFVARGTLAEFASTPSYLVINDFGAGSTARFQLVLTVPDGGAGAENAIMSDSYAFDLDFGLVQDGFAGSV